MIYKALFSFFLIALCRCAIAADTLDVAPEVLDAQRQRVETMQKASEATVAIFGLDGSGGGSGVIVTPDGYALTNYHVSSACGDHMRCGLNNETGFKPASTVAPNHGCRSLRSITASSPPPPDAPPEFPAGQGPRPGGAPSEWGRGRGSASCIPPR